VPRFKCGCIYVEDSKTFSALCADYRQHERGQRRVPEHENGAGDELDQRECGCAYNVTAQKWAGLCAEYREHATADEKNAKTPWRERERAARKED